MYGGPQLSHQNQMLTANYKSLTSNSNHSQRIQIAHIKFKSLTANSNRSQQIQIAHSKLQIAHGKLQIAHSKFKLQIIGCFPLCQTDRSEISGTTQGKWNDIFLLNRANQLGIALATSYHFRIP